MTEGERYLWNVIPAEAGIQVEETGFRIKSRMTLYRGSQFIFLKFEFWIVSSFDIRISSL